MKNQLVWSLLLFVVSASASAGEIVLTNGDRLSGELLNIEGGSLHWQSDSLGDVAIGIALIQSINTDTQVANAELNGPCQIIGLEGANLTYRCGDTAGDLPLTADTNLDTYKDPNIVVSEYRGKLVAAGRQRSGNTEEKSISVDSEAVYRRGDMRHQAKIDFDTLDDDSDNSGDRLVLRYDLDWFFKERWYWFNGLQAGYDEPADIESRYRYGTGLGFQVWDTQNSALALQSGLSYVSETEEDPVIPDPAFEATNRFTAWQWSLDYRQILFGKAEFFHKQLLIKSLEESEDWNLETETGISAPFIGSLYGEIKVDYDVDNTPADDKRREDTQVNVGVGYSW